MNPPIFFSKNPSTPDIHTLSLHDALPISKSSSVPISRMSSGTKTLRFRHRENGQTWILISIRSEEHTSELQSRFDLVCRLLLEKKKETDTSTVIITRLQQALRAAPCQHGA